MVLFTDHTDRELIPKSEVDLFWQTKAPGECVRENSMIAERKAAVAFARLLKFLTLPVIQIGFPQTRRVSMKLMQRLLIG